jgi:hypothetical protein
MHMGRNQRRAVPMHHPNLLLIAFPALMIAAVMLRLRPWLRASLFALLVLGELTTIAHVTVSHVEGQVVAFAE